LHFTNIGAVRLKIVQYRATGTEEAITEKWADFGNSGTIPRGAFG